MPVEYFRTLANLCALKWEYPEYGLHEIAGEIQSSLAQCGLSNINLGATYQADRLSELGEVIESALDHVYISDDIKTATLVKKLETSSTDHVPIIAVLNLQKEKAIFKPIKVTKRCMKNFTVEIVINTYIPTYTLRRSTQN